MTTHKIKIAKNAGNRLVINVSYDTNSIYKMLVGCFTDDYNSKVVCSVCVITIMFDLHSKIYI